MIEYINHRCNEWARWALCRRDGGLGLPRECCYTRLMPRSPHVGSTVEMNEAAMEIEDALRDMTTRGHTHLVAAVREFYLRAGGQTVDQISVRCGCCRRTLFYRIDMAHNEIMGYLNDMAAGVMPVRVDYLQKIA